MTVRSVRTHKITNKDTNIFTIIEKYTPSLPERSIIVIASKIVAITEGRVVEVTPDEKDALVKSEADLYLPAENNRYGLYVTIKDNYLTYSSGIDESNVANGVVLWPKDAQRSANSIRAFLQKKYKLKYVGVIITDMAAIPLQTGIIAGAIAYSGFKPFNNITGKPDLFGRKFKYTWTGVLQGLAASAGVVMGEGSEQTPIAVIEDVPFVRFQTKNPSKKERESLTMQPDADMYGQMITAAPWKKGRGKE